MGGNEQRSISRSRVPKRLIGASVIVAVAVVAGPFVIRGNELALGLFGLIVAFATTLISVYATKWYAEASARDELTRYGLQAWRNLDSLQVKVSQQINDSEVEDRVLAGWLLDIDQAKWAWQDLLREVFKLQARFETETSEVASRYKAQIHSAMSPEAKSELESKQAAELATIASKAPLPLRVPAEVVCPRCKAQVTARLGQSSGDTAWPVCGTCQLRFPIHRQPDGGIRIGEAESKAEVLAKCPRCTGDLRLWIPKGRSILFISICPHCKTHVQFNGTAESHQLEDLKVTNTEFTCPECGGEYSGWVSPGRPVRFLTSCEVCHKPVQVVSDGSNAVAVKAGTAATA